MEKSILDTDILSEILRSKNANVLRRADAYLSVFGAFTMSAVTVAEIVQGYRYGGNDNLIESFLLRLESEKHRVVAMDLEIAKVAGLIRGDLLRLGQVIGQDDPLIAATAISLDYMLVTGNTRHFERIVNLGYQLRLDDWRA
jgi:tRNA(fMet)-specific endonuclease VapC